MYKRFPQISPKTKISFLHFSRPMREFYFRTTEVIFAVVQIVHGKSINGLYSFLHEIAYRQKTFLKKSYFNVIIEKLREDNQSIASSNHFPIKEFFKSHSSLLSVSSLHKLIPCQPFSNTAILNGTPALL